MMAHVGHHTCHSNDDIESLLECKTKLRDVTEKFKVTEEENKTYKMYNEKLCDKLEELLEEKEENRRKVQNHFESQTIRGRKFCQMSLGDT